MKSVKLPDGTLVPALGQGTWMMGERQQHEEDEISALQAGIERGMTLIDTAEMYAEGGSERVVGKAVRGRREEVFLVSKAYPNNASRQRLERTCEASLERLATDRIDLYLLHWRGAVPLDEIVAGMERLVEGGKILRWGVSNLDANDMKELMDNGGVSCAVDQILYNLGRRGPEFELIPWLSEHSIPVMAYSPIEQGRLIHNGELRDIASEREASPAQVALAWLLRRPDVIAIPKAGSSAHVLENFAGANIALTDDELATLDRAFPPPSTRLPLEML